MVMASAAAASEVDIWLRIIHPRGKMSKAQARQIMKLDLAEEDHERIHDLAARNRRAELSEDEEAELDNFLRVGNLLSVLKVRAERVLKTRKGGH
jgi:hypothetical protein